MPLKFIAIIVFFIGMAGLVLAFFWDRKKPKNSETSPLFDELFPQQEEWEPEAVDINESSDMPAIYSGLHKHKYLLPKDSNSLYTRLSSLFADQYNIAPRVRMADIILTKEQDITKQSGDVKNAMSVLSSTVFDFVLTDPHTGEIKLAMITEDQLEHSGNREFIVGLMSYLSFPLYPYEQLVGMDDNELAVDISETIDNAFYT
ncbi:DUF2726 domain-containing protein [Photorhabdus luminescens]|uniref:DUF2726 domain-containing protein n=1 Tax=Photorhabdus luminescens subsp. mexicana TaxID=2100167 RepID=A0A4R4INE3_PHOLU|nr:DUF2726 domain-containing protein [Photorhabdus luminescens]TDB42110.1 hypothetical protein C5468_25155 [Photorhabdus luminescens subsp. mexicana]